MTIEDLTSVLKVLKEHGEPDLKLSETTRDEYTKLIEEYRKVLTEQRDALSSLTDVGSLCLYASAVETKSNLENDAKGPESIYDSLDNYIDYLDTLEDTINAACRRIQADG